MKEDHINLNKEFQKISQKKSGGIGRTFEEQIGIKENTLDTPDYKGIEIKTKRNNSKSYINLFNMTPKGKEPYEIKRLNHKYGYPDREFKSLNVLQESVYCNQRTWIGSKYQFMLQINQQSEKIYLCIFDIYGDLIEKETYWDFNTIQEKLNKKLTNLAFIKASNKYINQKEYFHYNEINIYTLKNFQTFISLIEQGIIRVTFKIGIFKKGKRKGQIHDHGTSFCIKEQNLTKLFNHYQE